MEASVVCCPFIKSQRTTPTSLKRHRNKISSKLFTTLGRLDVPASKMRRIEKVVNRLRISDIWKMVKFKMNYFLSINNSKFSSAPTHFDEVLFFRLALENFSGKSATDFGRVVAVWKYETWMIVFTLENIRSSQLVGNRLFFFVLHWKTKSEDKKYFSCEFLYDLEMLLPIVFQEFRFAALRMLIVGFLVAFNRTFPTLFHDFWQNSRGIVKEYIVASKFTNLFVSFFIL